MTAEYPRQDFVWDRSGKHPSLEQPIPKYANPHPKRAGGTDEAQDLVRLGIERAQNVTARLQKEKEARARMCAGLAAEEIEEAETYAPGEVSGDASVNLRREKAGYPPESSALTDRQHREEGLRAWREERRKKSNPALVPEAEGDTAAYLAALEAVDPATVDDVETRVRAIVRKRTGALLGRPPEEAKKPATAWHTVRTWMERGVRTLLWQKRRLTKTPTDRIAATMRRYGICLREVLPEKTIARIHGRAGDLMERTGRALDTAFKGTATALREESTRIFRNTHPKTKIQ